MQNAEENTTVTLHCSVATKDYINRFWFKGYINSYDWITNDIVLFRQNSSGNLQKSTARADMSVDPTTFALTIGRVQLEDDRYFTCRVFESEALLTLYNQSGLEVYSELLRNMLPLDLIHLYRF